MFTTTPKWLGLTIVATAVTIATGCAQQSSSTQATIEDRTYAVTPASVTVKAGIVTGEIADMKVTERVEKGSDRIVTPAKLTATLKLKNTSGNETVRLVTGTFRYVDVSGKPIVLDAAQAQPTLTFASSSGDRLDPGQEASQSVDVDFPAEALKAKRLRQIRLDLAYVPSPYRQESASFAVSVDGGK